MRSNLAATSSRQKESRREIMAGKIRPLNDRVIVKIIEGGETTRGGLYIPDVAKNKACRGVVLAVGPGDRSQHTGERLPLDVKEGDIVVFGEYSGSDLDKLGHKDIMAMREGEIIGVEAPQPEEEPARDSQETAA